LDKQLEDYYGARLEMFRTKGWKDLMEDVQNMKASTNHVSGIDDLRQLGLRQGEVSMMDWLLTLQTVSEDAYNELKLEEE
jgi:hypothetical protein